MRYSSRSRRWLSSLLVLSLAAQSFGCGTILHPERRGQPPTGRLDPSIVILDAVGLLLFFIPGVIAFAVDFSNGTIYLPPEETGPTFGDAGPHGKPAALVAHRIDPEQLDRETIEAVVSRRTGKAVQLDSADLRVAELDGIDTFAEESQKLASDWHNATPTQVYFP